MKIVSLSTNNESLSVESLSRLDGKIDNESTAPKAFGAANRQPSTANPQPFLKLLTFNFLLLTFLLLTNTGWGQTTLYNHNFGTTTISGKPYTTAPGTLNTDLSNSLWYTNTTSFTNFTGSSGEALAINSLMTSSPTMTLSFDIACGKQLEITSLSFWRQRSSTGPTNYSISINGGSAVASGTNPTTGASTGSLAVSGQSGLTGRVNITISLTGASSATGTFRIDDFTINGTITNSSVNSSSATATYVLTSNANATLAPASPNNTITATALTVSSWTSSSAATSNASFGANATNWSSSRDGAKYFQVTAAPVSGKNFLLNRIELNSWTNSTSSSTTSFEIWYSSDASFTGATKIDATISPLTTTSTKYILTPGTPILVSSGNTIYIRIYGISSSTSRYVNITNLILGGCTYDNNNIWDTNGTTGGSGNAGGSWSEAKWTNNSAGTTTTGNFTNNSTPTFSAGIDGTGTFSVNVDAAVNANGISFEEGTVTLGANSGTLTLTGATVTVGSNATGIIEEPVSGSVGLTKQGAGTLTLTGANAYSNGTTISAGTLQIGNGGTTGSVAGNIANSTSLIINRSNNYSYSGVISGAGTISKQGAGVTTLSGTNTYTGTTTVNAGTLIIGGGGRIYQGATGSITVSNNAVLRITNDAYNALGEGGSGGYSSVILNAGTSLQLNNTSNNAHNVLDLTLNGATVSSVNGPGGTANDGGFGNLSLNGNLTVGGSAASTISTTTCLLNGLRTMDVADVTSNANTDLTISAQIINSAGGINKTGAGTLTLTGNNLYTGATTINAGVLNIRNNQGTGTTAGGVSVASGAALELESAAVGSETLSLAGTGVSNGGALRFISGTNSWAGAITQTAASRINADAGTNIIDVSSGNAITGTFNLTIGGAGNLTIADPIATSTGTLTKDGNGTLTLSGANTYTGATTINAGTLALSGSGAIASLSSITVGSGGTFDVTGLTTALTLAASQPLYAAATGSNTTGTLTVSNTKGLTLSAGGINFTAYGGGATAPLTVTGASAGVLALNSAPVTVTTTAALGGGTYVLIDKSGSATGVTGTPGTLQWAGSGIVAGGTASLSVSNGQLLLIIIASGNYWDGNGSAAGVGGSGTWSSNSNTWATAADGTNGGVTQGTGNLVFGGTAGTVTVSGTVTVPAGKTFNTDGYSFTGGTISLTGASAAANTLTLGSGINTTIGSALSGSNGFTKAGAGTLTLTATNTYTGNLNITGGTLIASGVVPSILNNRPIDISSGATLRFSANSDFQQPNQTITGAGTIEQNGSRVSTLGNINDHTGDLVINSGDYDSRTGQAIGDNSRVIINSSGKLTLVLTADETVGTIEGNGTIDFYGAGNPRLILSGNTDRTFSGTITGTGAPADATGALVKNGSGSLTLSGSNSFSGGIRLNAGTLKLGNASALGAGNFYISGGTIDNSTGASMTLATTNTQTWAGSFTYTGTNDLTTNLSTGAITLTVNPVVTVSSNNLVVNGAIGGAYAITKSGNGSLRLRGANTFSGGITVTAGYLFATGSTTAGNGAYSNTGTGSVVVQSGATIGGTQQIGHLTTGPVTIESGGFISPGAPNPVGSAAAYATLRTYGNLTINGTYNCEYSGSSVDRITVDGTLTLSGATLNVSGSSITAPLIIASYSTLSGTFSTINNLPAGYTIDYNYNSQNQIAIVVVTSPTVTASPTTLSSLMTTTYGTPSTAQTFTVSGSSLTANLVVTAPAGLEVSTDNSSFSSSVSLTPSSGTVNNTTIYVRLAATAAAGTYNSLNIAVTSTGATTVNVSTTSSGNEVTQKALTITGLNGNNKEYDGNTTATAGGAASLSGVVNGDVVVLGGTPVYTFATATVGTGISISTSGYSISGAGAGNYTLTQPTLSANITAKQLTISGLTGNNKVYDGNNTASASGTATLNGVVSPDAVTLSGTPSFTFAQTTVGNSIIITAGGYTLSGAQAGNYTLQQPTGLTGNITAKQLTVTGLTGNNKVYDGNNTATVSGTAALSGVVSPDVVNLGGTPLYTFASINVGTGISISTGGYTISGADAGNYTLTQPTLSANITAKQLTITGLTGNNKVYDGNNTASVSGTAALSGVVSPDIVTLSGTATFTFAQSTVGNSIAISASGYTLSGAQAGNYTLQQPTGLTGNITAVTLTVTGASVVTKAYDGNTQATITGASLVGVISPDVVTISNLNTAGNGTFANANPGTGISVTAALTLGGADNGNYTLTQPTGLTGTITPVTQTGDAFRSKQTGNWNSTSTWESNSFGNWVDATTTPDATNAGAITIRENHTVTVTAGVTVDQVTIDALGQVTVNASQTLTVADGTGTDVTVNGTLLMSGSWSISSPATWTVGAGGTYIHNTTSAISPPLDRVSPALSATSNFVYRGSSSLTPALSLSSRTYGNISFESTSGTLTFTNLSGAGALTVSGTFSVGNTAVGFNSPVVLDFDGSSQDFTGAVSVTGSVTINSSSTWELAPSQSVTVGGNWTNNSTFNAGTSTVTLNGTLDQSISGTSTFNNLTINKTSGAVNLQNNQTVAGTLALTAGAVNLGANTLTHTGASVTRTSGTISATTGIFNVNSTSNYTLPAGTLTNTVALTKNNSGSLTLASQSHSGGVTLSVGTIVIADNSALGSGTFTISGGTVNTDATARSITNPVSIGGNFTFTGTNNLTQSTGTITLTATSTITASASTLTFGGVISGGFGITKAGSGTLTLSNANTYTGATTINAGTLSISSIANGGTASGIGQSSNIASNLVLGGGTLLYTGPTASIDRNYILTAGTTSTINTTNNLTISGASTSTTGALTKQGAGTLILTGTNLHTGTTTIGAGTLQIGDGGTTGSVAGNITKNGNLIFDRSNDFTYAGNILGSTGKLTKRGAGILTLVPASGSNSFTGGIDIEGGTIRVGIFSTHLNMLNQTLTLNGGNLQVGDGSTGLGGTVGTVAVGFTVGANGGSYINSQNIAGTLELSGAITNNSGGTLTLQNTTQTNSLFSGVISGNGSIIVNNTGAGVTTLSGNNTYSGTTTVTAGILRIGAADRISNSSNLILNGGTFSTGATTGFNETLGTLDLDANSTIALGTGSHTLTFSNSNSVSWNGSSTLTITGWSGTAGASGTAGKIVVGAGGLSTTQLAQITFSGYCTGAMILGTELVPVGATLGAYSTQLSGNIEKGTTNAPIAGFTMNHGIEASFSSITVTGATATSSDVTNMRIFRDNNGDGLINGSDAAVSNTLAFGAAMNFTLSGETFSGSRSYLIVGDISGTATAASVQVSITTGAFTTFCAAGSIGSVAQTTRPLINSAVSDIVRSTGFTESSNILYTQYQSTGIHAAGAGNGNIKIGEFVLRDGGASALDLDGLGTTMTAITFTVGNNGNLRRLALYDHTGNTFIGTEINSVTSSVSFTGLNFTASDNSTRTFSVYASFNTAVTDNEQISLTVSSVTALAAGSGFAAANGGAAATSTAGDANRIEVVADRLAFVQQPSNTVIDGTMSPAVTVHAADVHNNRDLDFTGSITLESTGTLTGNPVAANAVLGIATFSSLVHTAEGIGLTLSASSTVTGATSTTFNITTATEPVVVTGTLGTVTDTQAPITSNNVTSDGGSPITERGVVYSLGALPTILDSKLISTGTLGTFNSTITGLTPGTIYYARAYATNAVGTGYGAVVVIATSRTITFRDGLNGYAGTEDTYVRSTSATTSFGNSDIVEVDQDPQDHGLFRFNNIVGCGTNQIPQNAQITSATFSFTVIEEGEGTRVFRMNGNWNESSTWNSLTGGVTIGTETPSNPITSFGSSDGSTSDFTIGTYNVTGIASIVQEWVNGTAANNGFAIIHFPASDDGADIASSENATTNNRPSLSVTYRPTVSGEVYRTVTNANGNWSNTANWEFAPTANSTSWTAACAYPTTSNSSEVIIRSNTSIVMDLSTSVDKLTVDGQLEISAAQRLSIMNGQSGADFALNGTLVDRGSSSNGLLFENNTGTANDASWTMGDAATIIKTNQSSVQNYNDFYQGGMSTIPATANWYYRNNGDGVVATAAVGMYYPNLYFENTQNSNNYAFNTLTSALRGNTGGYATVKGSMNVGTTGQGTVTLHNSNINSQPMLIQGNLTIEANSTLTNASYDGSSSSGHGNGTGFEVQGNLIVNGTFTNNTDGSGVLRMTGGNEQTISGGGTINLRDVTLNKSAGSVTLSRELTVGNALSLQAGTLAVSTQTLTLNGTVSAGTGTLSSAVTGTVVYNQSADGQTVLAANYGNLTFNNNNKILPAATVGVAGNFTPGTGTGHTITGNTVDFNGTASQTIGAPFTFNNLRITGDKNNGTITLGNGTIALNGDYTVSASNISSFVTTNNTFEFINTGSQQLMTATVPLYFNNLVVNKSTQTLNAISTSTINIAGEFTLSAGQFIPGPTSMINMTGGNWTNNGGTYTRGNTTVVFSGSGEQVIGGTTTAAQEFANVTIDKQSGNLTIAANKQVKVNNNFALTNGNFAPGAGTMVEFDKVGETQTVPLANYHHLKLSSGGTKTLADNIAVAGDLLVENPAVGTTTAIAGARIRLNGNSEQSIGGMAFRSVEISGTGNKRLTDHASLNGAMTFTGGAGTIDLDGEQNNKIFTIKSTADSTSRIANKGNWTLSGKAVVERYVPSQRKWRLISVPTVPGETLRQALTRQIDGSYPNPVCFTADAQAGSGTLITGHSMSSCTNATSVGFDHLVSGGASSIRFYNTAAGNPWASNTSTPNVLAPPTQSGYLVFIRGDRQATASGSNITTLRPKGDLIQGDYSIAYSSRYFVLGNPYASPISFESLYADNADKIFRKFWVWDANLTNSTNGVGGYRSFTPDNENAQNPEYTVSPTLPPGTTVNDFLTINSSQAIMVERRNTASISGSLLVKETHKLGERGNMLTLRTSNTPVAKFKVDMYRANGSNLEMPMDGLVARFADWYDMEPTDIYDVYKHNQFEENICLLRKDQTNVMRYLAIESRPLPSATDTIFMPFYQVTNRGYALRISTENFAGSNLSAYLQDAFTGTEIMVPLDGSVFIYPFSVSADANSKALTRLRVVFRPSVITSTPDIYTTKNIIIYPNPVVKADGLNLQFRNTGAGRYTMHVYDMLGVRVHTAIVVHAGGNGVQKISLPGNMVSGTYFVELNDGKGNSGKEKVIVQ